MFFWTESLVLWYANVRAARDWWITTFDCEEATEKPDWDDLLPSDVALILDGLDPSVLLRDRNDAKRDGSDEPTSHPLLFCSKIEKAHDFFRLRGAAKSD